MVGNGLAGQPGPPPPPGSPGQYHLTLQITGPRADNLFSQALTPPDGPSLPQTSFESIDIGTAQVRDPWHGTDENPVYWTTGRATWTFTRAYNGTPGDWHLHDGESNNTGDYVLPIGNNANFSHDLGYWAPEARLRTLQISLSRWATDTAPRLWLRQRDGWSAQVTALGTVDWPSVSADGRVWSDSAFTFNAETYIRDEVDYWLYDEETGEESPYNTTNLIGWFALPTPSGLSGMITAQGVAELQWPLVSPPASIEGGFEIQRKLSGETVWQTIGTISANSVDNNNLMHYPDSSLVFNKTHSYRVRYTFGPRHSAGSNVAALTGWLDSDGDGLAGALEISLGTDPNNPDSDGDTVSDGDEVAAGTDPLNPAPTLTILGPAGASLN